MPDHPPSLDRSPSPILPDAQRLLAVGWGVSVEAFLVDHPGARLERATADVQVYSLTHAVGDTGVSARAAWTFSLDALVSVDLTCPADADAFAIAARALVRVGTADAEALDLGYEGLVVGETRLTIDHLDGRIRLEEA